MENANLSRPTYPLNKRWIAPGDLLEFLETIKSDDQFTIELIGLSPMKFPIHTVSWGKGPTKVMAWTQMHGNEATATLAMMDFLQELKDGQHQDLKEQISLKLILMLNPDGAELYRRRNALAIDLNRDALQKSAPETQLFFHCLEAFAPDWAFNMHDQRNIFSAGESKRCASLSFLAPSAELSRAVTPERRRTMQLIAGIHEKIEAEAEGHFGRYTDEFYPRALGDNLMRMRIPNILFEAGAFPKDPTRLKARSLCKNAFKEGLALIANGSWQKYREEQYQNIPENKEKLRDLIFRNCNYKGSKVDLALMKKESADPKTGEWQILYIVNDLGDLRHLYGIEEFIGLEILSDAAFDLEESANFTILGEEHKYHFEDGKLQEH